MKKIIIILFVTLSHFESYCQENQNVCLLVAEFKKDSTTGAGDYTYIVSYQFRAGRFILKDTIFGADVGREGIPGSYVRFDLGNNFIYKDRYIVSGIGNVIDIKTRSLLMEESDDFVETLGDTIVFYRNKEDKGYLILDLYKKSYNFAPTSFYPVKGINSPDHKHGLDIDRSDFPYKIVLTSQFDSTIIVNSSGITSMHLFSCELPTIPVKWIDNEHFIYADYHHSGYTLKIFDIINKKVVNLPFIDSIPKATINPCFYRDRIGNIIFNCAKGDFKIDYVNYKIDKYIYTQLGNNFEIELYSDSLGHVIRYNNIEIGKIWCSIYPSPTCQQYIALEYGNIGSNLGYPKGIKIWNEINSQWMTIDVPWLCTIIGWVSN